MLNGLNCQNDDHQILSLLESVNETSNTTAIILFHLAHSLRALEVNQNETTMFLAQMAQTQTQMANTLHDIVGMLQGKVFQGFPIID